MICLLKLAPQATAGGPGPMRASLFNIVLPPPQHTQTHTHTPGLVCIRLTCIDRCADNASRELPLAGTEGDGTTSEAGQLAFGTHTFEEGLKLAV